MNINLLRIDGSRFTEFLESMPTFLNRGYSRSWQRSWCVQLISKNN